MEHNAESDAGCCSACGGLGGGMYGVCWDCRGTGCAHPEPLCVSVTPPGGRKTFSEYAAARAETAGPDEAAAIEVFDALYTRDTPPGSGSEAKTP